MTTPDKANENTPPEESIAEIPPVEGDHQKPVEEASKKKLAIELFLISFVSLYLELLVIRWLSGEVRFFTVFRTFPLVACFVGLGLGCALANKKLFRMCGIALLATVAFAKVLAITGLRFRMFPSVGIYSWQEMAAINLPEILLCATCVLLMLAGPFAAMTCIGAKLGELFNRFRPLTAYSIDVAGAIAGSIVFALVSFWGLHPWALLIPAFVVLCYFMQRDRVNLFLSVIPLIAAVVILWLPVDPPSTETYWSPYQQLTLHPFREYFPADWSAKDVRGLWITQDPAKQEAALSVIDRCYVMLLNHGPYLSSVDLSPKALATVAESKPFGFRLGIESRRYQLPYKLKAPGEILIVGSGTGNDVAAALRNGAQHVDAVELDPIIIDIGKRKHPEHPYANERVTVVCDDARHFFNVCAKRYDMVILGGLNSQTVVGQGSSVRVDTYVHTKESIERALSLLKPDGMLLLTSYDTLDWLGERVFATMRAAAGYDPLVLFDNTPNTTIYWDTFVLGAKVKEGQLKSPGFPYLEKKFGKKLERVVTDDWPYMYVAPVDFDGPYWFVMSIVMLIAAISGSSLVLQKNSKPFWQMFFLGAAFLLLELKSIAQLSLLFGSTWLTSSIVIDVILLMVLAANFIVSKFGHLPMMGQGKLYPLLFLLLAGSFFSPGATVLSASLPPLLSTVSLTLLSLLPLFAASLIFSSAFKNVANPSRALAFNLFGAVVGGLLEYASNYTGIRFLVLIAAFLYGMSCLMYLRGSRLQAKS